MVVYSIKDLENLTGIKAHTIRIWEKRYGIIEPRRTNTNIRYYLEEDLKKIMNIALLNRNGYKISKIAKLQNNDIHSIAAKLTDVDKTFENQLDGLTLSVLELNEDNFLKIFNANISQNGFKQTMLDVIYPLLDKLGMMWMTGSIEPIHENFVSHLIKRKCVVEIDKLDVKRDNPKKFLLFLPKSEQGELSLNFLHYIIKSKGHKAINLGLNVDVQNVFSGCHIYHPDLILTIIDNMEDPSTYSEYIDLLVQQSCEANLLLSGLQVMRQKKLYSNKIQTFQSSLELEKILDELALNEFAE